ncbi:MAG: O-antigen ligase family protein [Propionicimonas sp.]
MAATRTDRVATVSVVAFALVLPLAASPLATDSTFASRLLVAAIGIGLAALIPSRNRLPRPVLWALAAGLAVFIAAALAGATPVLSLLGRYPRYEGLVTVLGYAGALVAGVRLLGPDRPRSRDLFCSASSLAAMITAGLALVQAVLLPDERVTALLGNSSVLGTWAAVIACLLGWNLLRTRRALWMAGFAAALLTVLLSASRGAMLAIAVACLAAALLGRWAKPRPAAWLPLGLAGAFGAAAWLLPSVRGRLTGSTPFAEATVSGRTVLWSDSWQLVTANPLLGVGPSRFVDTIGAFHTVSWAASVGPYAPPDSPHNLALQVLAATGAAGLVAVTGFLVVVVAALWRRRPWDAWTAAAGLATLASGIAYLFSFTDPLTTTIALVCLGGALADRGTGKDRFPTRILVGAWAAVSMILAASTLLAEARFSSVVSGPPPTTNDVLRVASVRPWDPDLTRRLGHAVARLAEQGIVDPAPAIPAVSDACRALVSSTECLHTLGDLQALAGDPESSVQTLTVALSLDPTNVDTLLKRSIAHAEAGDAEAAEADLLRAAALRPAAPEPWENLAILYQQTGRADDALSAAARAEELRR